MRLYLTFLGISVWVLTMVACYPQGPPYSACRDMFPEQHGADSKTDTPPFEILLSQNVYRPWEQLRVTLRSTRKDTFIKGFFLQARRANCSQPNQQEAVGVFKQINNEDYLKTSTCQGGNNNAVSHSKILRKHDVTVMWNAPGTDIGHIYFVATVVKSRKIFWTNVHSEILRDVEIDSTKDAEVCPSRESLTTTKPTTTRITASTAKQASSSSRSVLDNKCMVLLFIMTILRRMVKN